MVRRIWLADPPPQAAAVDPAELAQRAVDSMKLAGPDIASPRTAGRYLIGCRCDVGDLEPHDVRAQHRIGVSGWRDGHRVGERGEDRVADGRRRGRDVYRPRHPLHGSCG